MLDPLSDRGVKRKNPMKAMRSEFRLLMKLCILVVLVVAGACSKKEAVVLPPIKVNVVKAVQNDVPLYEEFVAQTFGLADVDIRARVEGWVTEVGFKEGAAVKKGRSSLHH
jgi:membrane fusion protein, multidrug efflux system